MKTKRISIRITPEEQTQIRQLADSRHVSVSDYVKSLIFSQKIV